MSDRSDFVVVANRLPVDRASDGEWQRSPGGLVTALEPVMESHQGAWVGWAGDTGEAPEPFTLDYLRLHPVALSDEDVVDYYEGFSNGTLWPLYHDAVAAPQYHRHWWNRYVDVNQRFADATAEVAEQGATVWVQDYQLQLVPGMLRAVRPDLRVGFFLHIPFPPVELFMQLPWRAKLIKGLLGADLIGFQTPEGADNFVRLAQRLCDVGHTGDEIKVDGRTVRADAFPISIDVEALRRMARSDAIQQRAAEIRRELHDPEHVLLGVDRLDYTKGIDKRLKAFRELLGDGTISVPETVLVQVATPSRERVEHYQALREQIEREVGRINGTFGALGATPVHYLRQSYSREELCALYNAADVMLVTPLRDGMNLVAKEYVASRPDYGGALVLSEFTGAAAQMGEAFLVNPHDVDGLKQAVLDALAVDTDEGRRRMKVMSDQLTGQDVAAWAERFLSTLGVTGPETD